MKGALILMSVMGLLGVTGRASAKPITAALVSRDLAGHSSLPDAPGGLTFDPNTELEWLDWTLSTNRSFNDVSSQLGAGGDFEGFRYASLPEVLTLYNNAGLDTTNWLFGTTVVDGGVSANSFIDLFGETNAAPGVDRRTGAISSSPAVLATPPDRALVEVVHNLVPLTSITAAEGHIDQNFPSTIVGSALVRPGAAEVTVTPEPASLVLWLLMGLVAALWMWRRYGLKTLQS